MSITEKVKKSVEAAVEVWNKPEEFLKGEEFEQYVRKTLFPTEHYRLLEKAHSCQSNKNDYVESSRNPDFKLCPLATNKEFYIEAKFRGSLFNGAVDWCKPHQLKRYKQINKTTPVIIVIGLGGRSDMPGKVYVVPVSEIPYGYTSLYPSFLKDYQVSPRQPVHPQLIGSMLRRVAPKMRGL